jgi:hypothetical protein
MHLPFPYRSLARPRWRLIAAAGVVAAAAVVILVVRPGMSAGSQLAKDCPSESLVTAKLAQKITHSSSAQLSYGDYNAPNNSGNRGSRLTCTYKTDKGKTIQFILTSNAHTDAIVAAEEAGFGWTQTFSGGAGFEHQKKAPQVVGAFGKAKIAWTLKNGQILDALYGNHTNLLIVAPGASKAQLENLARSTLGTPQVNMGIDRAT